MCDGELVVLYNEDNDVYCKYKTFALGSEEAKKAHEDIRKIQQEGCKIINVENMTEEEMNLFLKRIDLRIKKDSELNNLDVNMIIKSIDLESFFGPDGFCFIDNLKCATSEIEELLKNPEKVSELKVIKEVPYMAADIRKEVSTGYMIPMLASGDFFSLDEAKNICGLNPISTTRDALHCQFALDSNSKKNLLLINAFRKAKRSDASDEDKMKFKKEEQLMFDEYKANYELIQSYKNTREQVLEIYFRNNKKK